MDPDQDGFTIRGDWAAPGSPHIVGHYSLADFGKLAVEKLGAGLPLVINDNLKELAPEEAATFQGIGIGATICMPLVKEGRLTALMAIHHKDPHVWTDDELALITEVTERSWAHIERVRSEAEVRAGEQRFRAELEATGRRAHRGAAAERQEHPHGVRDLLLESGPAHARRQDRLRQRHGAREHQARLEDVSARTSGTRPGSPRRPACPKGSRGRRARRRRRERPDRDAARLPTGDRIYEFSMRPALDETGKVVALVPEADRRHCARPRRAGAAQAQKIEAIGNLTGGIAHDFNNLLMAVLGSLELLRKRLPTTALLRLVDNAAEGARRGKSLTQRMLAFARRQDLKPERVDSRSW